MTMPTYQCLTTPLRLFHGADSLGQLGKELDRLKASRAVIFCGGSLARNTALLDKVRNALGPRCAGVFAGIKAHSPVPDVLLATEDLRRFNADAVVAVGGGSAIVTARAASILLAEGTDVGALCTVPDGKGGLKSPRLMAAKLPQFVIPTTPTTAAVKAGSALFNPELGERQALFDPKTRAAAIFIDPDMMLSAPRALVSSAGVNTLSTAIEGLMSRAGNPVSDALLMHSVRLLAQHLGAGADLDDAAIRGESALAALLCGQGTDHTGAGITTVLGHALGARFDVENGTINAIVLPHVLAFNADHGAKGLAKVGAALGVSDADLLPTVVGAVQRSFASLGMPARLRDVGVPAEELKDIAQIAMGDWFLKGNPRPVQSAAELLDILEKAW